MPCALQYFQFGFKRITKLKSALPTLRLLKTYSSSTGNGSTPYITVGCTTRHCRQHYGGGGTATNQLSFACTVRCSRHHNGLISATGSLMARPGPTPLGSSTRQHLHTSHPNYSTSDFQLHASTGISMEEYRSRRIKLMQALPPNSLVIVCSAPKKIMSNDIPFRYRQDSNMMYLTGFSEPEGVLLMRRGHNESLSGWSTLLVAPRNLSKEKWDGPRIDPIDAKDMFGVDTSESTESLSRVLGDALLAYPDVYCDLSALEAAGAKEQPHGAVQNALIEHARVHGRTIRGLRQHVEALRVVKSDAELALLQAACDTTSRAMRDAMTITHAGINENLIDATLEFGCRKRGATAAAFIPVVAGGARANTLHYVRNDRTVSDGSLVLVDAGAEQRMYNGDVSRTWPVNGVFTEAQRKLYSAVLRVQEQCIAHCTTPAASTNLQFASTLFGLHQLSLHLMLQELMPLGLISADAIDAEARGGTRTALTEVRAVYPHSIGHYLGMDVHDGGSQPLSLPFEPGMVITVEPGLYVPDSPEFPEEFRGIGIRIEDDVVITDGAPKVLTSACPKAVDELELIIGSAA
eukprot:m.284309 g.284309  ORF g.284309 m.284309 type:complete len:577 (-) comp19905_c0_seq1:219-1949(-)